MSSPVSISSAIRGSTSRQLIRSSSRAQTSLSSPLSSRQNLRSASISRQFSSVEKSSRSVSSIYSRRSFGQHAKNGKRWSSTAAVAEGENAKITSIVDQISKLTLLETADLVASLKSRLNIPDMSFAAPMSSGGAAPAAAAAAEAEDEPAPAAQEKSLFTLKLQSFEAASKPKIIKEVKAMLGLSLVDSKKFVESAPKVLKEGLPKDEAEKIVAAMKALGGVVVME